MMINVVPASLADVLLTIVLVYCILRCLRKKP